MAVFDEMLEFGEWVVAPFAHCCTTSPLEGTLSYCKICVGWEIFWCREGEQSNNICDLDSVPLKTGALFAFPFSPVEKGNLSSLTMN